MALPFFFESKEPAVAMPHSNIPHSISVMIAVVQMAPEREIRAFGLTTGLLAHHGIFNLTMSFI